MRRISLCMLVIFVASIAVLTAGQAFADRTLTIVNNRSKTVYTAVRFQDYREGNDGGVWTTIGWYETKPRQKRNILLHTDNDIIYTYTHEVKPIVEWAGDPNDSRDKNYWVTTKSFHLQGNTKPGTGTARVERFKRRYIRDKGLTLTYSR